MHPHVSPNHPLAFQAVPAQHMLIWVRFALSKREGGTLRLPEVAKLPVARGDARLSTAKYPLRLKRSDPEAACMKVNDQTSPGDKQLGKNNQINPGSRESP